MIEEVKEEQVQKPLKKTIQEILAERVGKVENTEIYSSSTQFIIIFPNDYSLVVTQTKRRSNKGKAQVYRGMGEVTSSFFPGNTWKRVDNKIIEAMIGRLESEER